MIYHLTYIDFRFENKELMRLILNSLLALKKYKGILRKQEVMPSELIQNIYELHNYIWYFYIFILKCPYVGMKVIKPAICFYPKAHSCSDWPDSEPLESEIDFWDDSRMQVKRASISANKKLNLESINKCYVFFFNWTTIDNNIN